MRQLERRSFLGRLVRTLVAPRLAGRRIAARAIDRRGAGPADAYFAARSFQLARVRGLNTDAPPTLRQRVTWHAAAVARAAAPLRGKDAAEAKARAERRAQVRAERATWAR